MLRSLAFAALAGVLIALGGAPMEMSFLALLAPGCLLVAIVPHHGVVVSGPRALLLGLVMGVSTNAISMGWIVGLLERFGHFPFVLALLVGALLWIGQSVAYALAAFSGAALIRRGIAGWIALPAALTLASTLTPALFPWRYGLSQLPFLPYAQVAELGGLPLLDWLVATCGCGLVAALRGGRRTPALAAAMALVLPAAYGVLRLPSVRAERAAAPTLRVGVAQPNVSIAEKHDVMRYYAQLQLLREQSRALEAEGAELVLWPETAYRYPIPRARRRDRRGALGLLADGVHGPLIAGVITTTGPASYFRAFDEGGRTVGTFSMGARARFNSAVALERDGRIVGIADKVHLLAFGEYTPLWDLIPWLQTSFPRGLTPGQGSQILEVAGARVGILNCYEDLLSEHVRIQSRYAPDFWANVTNNAWFGDGNAPHLHHMNARLRAIETRRDIVRAVNTGVSGHTASSGEDLARTSASTRARFVADVRLLRGTTLYAFLGDWVSPILAGILFGWIFVRRRLASS